MDASVRPPLSNSGSTHACKHAYANTHMYIHTYVHAHTYYRYNQNVAILHFIRRIYLTSIDLSFSTQESFLQSQQQLREERGIDNTDFHETKTVFQLNILARVQALD